MKNNIASASLKQWIKFALAALFLLFFVCWLGNAWWLLLLPLLFDIYVSKIIPWSAWKKAKNPMVRTIAEWIDAIVFALIAVYIINIYFFQNYKIPSSSLEKTLFVGDFLFVSKVAYGPRNPMTPFSFPLAQHTLPLVNTKSYIEKPQLEYKRLKGLGQVKLNDIVVFNFPAGDTVALKVQNPDYYTLIHQYGREQIKSEKRIFGEIVYRPVDRRENYVKRCVALPGDTFQIIDNQIFLNGKKLENIPGVQFNYYVQTTGMLFSDEMLDKLGISKDDRHREESEQVLNDLKFKRNPVNNKYNPVYRFPLTAAMLAELQKSPAVQEIKIQPAGLYRDDTFPLGNGKWTRDNYGPILIPKKGATVAINLENLPLYERIIKNYEGNLLVVRDGNIFINGKIANSYTFKMDYYWMMGDNRHNSADSRYWGFVPEDHIVGQPLFVWLSLDKDKDLFGGKIRFDRFFKNAKR